MKAVRHWGIRVAVALILTAGWLFARETGDWKAPRAAARRLEGGIRVDGRLDEPDWKTGKWYNDFRSASLESENRGIPKPVEIQTHWKARFDADAMYVAVRCEEPQPDRIVAEAGSHDGTVWRDDCVEVFFDPAGKGRYYHHFLVNTRGVWFDEYSADFGLVHRKLWHCPLDVGTRVDRDAKSWTVEVRIPFGALNLQEDAGSEWLWNVARERYAGGQLELSTWSPLKGKFHAPRKFGTLTGVSVDFTRFSFDLSVPDVRVEKARGKHRNITLSQSVTNESPFVRTVRPVARLFNEPGSAVEADPRELAPGEQLQVEFPPLKVGADRTAVNCLLALMDADSGTMIKGAVRNVPATYTPLDITLLRPCYRNTIFATQEIQKLRFRVTVTQDRLPEVHTVRYLLQDSRRKTLAEGAGDPAALDAPLTLKIPELKAGRYRLVVETVGKDDKTMHAARVPVRVVPPPPRGGNEVRIDQYGNLLVDGDPFVAIGWYGGAPLEDPRQDVIALQNVRLPLVVYPPDTTPISDVYEKHGIYSVVSIENRRLHNSFKLWSKKGSEGIRDEYQRLSEPSEEMRRYLKRLVQTVQDEPGLLGYYIADEPGIHNVVPEYLENMYKVMQELDPYHPVIVTNNTQDGIVTHGYRCADILSPDPYSSNYDYVPSFMRRCREVLRPGQTIMLTPWHASSQAHTTADYGTAPPYPYKVIRNQYLVSLAYGARGWTGYTTPFFMPEIVYRYGLPHIWREIRFLEPAMAEPPPAAKLDVTADAAVAGWVRQHGSHLYLVVVNHKPGARNVRVSHELLKSVDRLRVVSEDRMVAVSDGRFRDQFEVGDARIYTTDPDGAELPTLKEVEDELVRRQEAAVKPGNLLHVRHGTRAAASEGYYAPWFDQYYYYAINGITDDRGWSVLRPQETDSWLELTLPRPEKIGRVVLYTPNLRDYDLRFQDAAGGQHVAKIRANGETVVTHRFRPPVPCLKLRVIARSAGDERPQVSEIEAYREAGEGPVTDVRRLAAATPQINVDVDELFDCTKPAVMWTDSFSNFESTSKHSFRAEDPRWVLKPDQYKVEPQPGGGITCASSSKRGYASMKTFFPYAPVHRFFQVKISDIQGDGYQFTNVGLVAPSARAGSFRGGVNASKTGIFTVDTHYVHPRFKSGKAGRCLVRIGSAGARAKPDGTVEPGTAFTYDWIRLVSCPVNGLAVTLPDGTPLPEKIGNGDELLFYLHLEEPAADATVRLLAGSSYKPLAINGKQEIQLVRTGAGDGRQWAARVTLGEGTDRFDQSGNSYPVVFQTRIVGGSIDRTYATASLSIE